MRWCVGSNSEQEKNIKTRLNHFWQKKKTTLLSPATMSVYWKCTEVGWTASAGQNCICSVFLKFLSKRRSSYGIYLRAVNQSWSPTDILRWYLKMVQNYKIKLWSYTCPSNDWQPLDGGRSYKASSASSSQDGREPPLCSTPGACITPA